MNNRSHPRFHNLRFHNPFFHNPLFRSGCGPPWRCSQHHCTAQIPRFAALLAFFIAMPCAHAQKSPPEPPPARPPSSPPSDAEHPDGVSPPRVTQSVEAIYPPAALAEHREGLVELLVTVLVDGSVGDVEIATSNGAEFEDAAMIAILQWRFEPARRDGRAVRSRIRIPFRFALPEPEPAQPTGQPPAQPKDQQKNQQKDQPNDKPTDLPIGPPADPETSTSDPQKLPKIQPDNDTSIDITVHGKRAQRTQNRSAGDFHIDREILAAAPRTEGAEALRSAPGLYIGRSEGSAVAHHYMLRGFDAEHGQDIEFRVGSLPINLPSHLHSQGYADLGFLIGETIREMQVTEGVNDPRQGDFAVAGSINLSLGVEEKDRGVRIRSSYGSFNTFRQLVLWAPRSESEESFGTVQYTRTDGFGENRDGQAGSAIFQHRFGENSLTYRAIGILHTSRSNLAGVVRQDDVDNGNVCFDCVYPFPTAKAQNAMANRFLVGLFADYTGEENANGQVGVWLGYDNFRIQQNFTGFIHQSRVLERTSGRGDLIEQQNRTTSLGLTGRYRTAPFKPAEWASGTVEVGSDGRIDIIDQAQNYLDASTRSQTWDRTIDANVRGVDIGFWGDLDWHLTRFLCVRAGLRADVLSYDIEDKLGNFAPLTRPQDATIPGFRRSALGLAWGPRTSIEVHPIKWLTVLAAYGEGYRSPQARTLEDGEDAPFSKVRSTDFGLRFNGGSALQLTVGGYYTHLSDDIAFDATEGRLERIGATQRLGAVVNAVTHAIDWLVASASVTFVDATLLEPPPPTAAEPQPPFSKGQNLPNVPPVVVRADIGAHHTLVENLASHALEGRAGLGFSYLSARPLPYNDSSNSVALLDTSASLFFAPFELTFEIFNLLNTRYGAVEYSFPSYWNPNEGIRSRTPARHVSAGAPLSWMLSLGVTL